MLNSSTGWNKELPGSARTNPVIVAAAAMGSACGGIAFALVVRAEQ